jgi:hypothetical protein
MSFAHNSVITNDEPQWADVDKTKLPREAFADMGEDSKSSTWKFPHHWVRNGKNPDASGRPTDGQMYLHTGGLDAASSAANGTQKADSEVIKHLEAHRKALETPGEANSTASSDLEASVPTDGQLAFLAPMNVTASAVDGGAAGQRLPRFDINAYNGGPMCLANWGLPVVVDLQGVQTHSQNIPVLKDHRYADVVGHTDSVKVGASIDIAGVVSGTGPAAKEVVANSKNGFPWQASIGGRVLQKQYVAEGAKVNVNGADHHGPIIVARKFALGEVSVTALGADTSSSTTIAASAKGASPAQEITMTDTATQVAGTADKEAPAAAGPKIEASAANGAPDLTQIRASAAAEYKRIAEIDKLCGKKYPEIAASAIEKGWDSERIGTEIQLVDLRASRPTAPAVIVHEGISDTKTIEACGLIASGVRDDATMVKAYGEKAMDIAHRHRAMGIREFFALCASAEGRTLPPWSIGPNDFIRAAFSTVSLPGILSNIANKVMLDRYNAVDRAWQAFCKKGILNDFKTHYRYRMTEDFKFKPVGPDGQLPNVQLGEQAYQIQAGTQGAIITLARQMIVNDDMNAFADMPARFGIGAGEGVAETVYTPLLNNPNLVQDVQANPPQTPVQFFSAANNNYLSGAGTQFGFAGLSGLYNQFLLQTKPNGRPLNVEPKILLVPTQLKLAAIQLMKQTPLIASIATTGAKSTVTPSYNVLGDLFEVVSSQYLSNTTFNANALATAYYLFADPMLLPAIEVAFLNGIEQPVIERGEPNFEILGIRFRAFLDWGVAMEDFRGAAYSKGDQP